MQFIPSEIIKDSIDNYLIQHTTASQKIYWAILFMVVAITVSLPFIYVDISIHEQGIIRPLVEKTEIKASISEFVDSVYVKEGQVMNQGDTILTFRRSASDYKIRYQQKRVNDFQDNLSDLRMLVKGEKPAAFNSNMRRQEYMFYIQKKKEYENNLSKATKDFERNKTLFEKKIISEEEYEKYQYEYTRSVNELASLIDNQINQWQRDLNSYSNMYDEMTTSLNQEIKNKDLYVVTSPVSGTIDQFSGIYAGSSIQAGNAIAIISPDSTLFAEIYVSPFNIGYIYQGMPAKIQVSSYNYNEWGIMTGEVAEISSDFLTDNSGKNAFYKVKCHIENNYLVHKNGTKGMLKKGMAVSSNFIVTERSLFHLLHQKIDYMANPSQFTLNNLAQNEKTN